MSTPEIIRKLGEELDKGITTEVQVVYVLAGVRKLIERDKVQDQYSDLRFHCDWALHSKMDRKAAKAILKKFDDAHVLLRENIELHELPSELRKEIDRISQMRSFKEELSRFLSAYDLPPLTKNRRDGWSHFLHLYTQVITDIPLVVSLPTEKRKAKLRMAESGPKHISDVTVSIDLARETIKDGAVEHLLFRVNWTTRDKNGKSGTIFTINSFTR
jgi:hypothetical protein